MDAVDPETGIRIQATVTAGQRCGNEYCNYPVWRLPWEPLEYLCEWCR